MVYEKIVIAFVFLKKKIYIYMIDLIALLAVMRSEYFKSISQIQRFPVQKICPQILSGPVGDLFSSP